MVTCQAQLQQLAQRNEPQQLQSSFALREEEEQTLLQRSGRLPLLLPEPHASSPLDISFVVSNFTSALPKGRGWALAWCGSGVEKAWTNLNALAGLSSKLCWICAKSTTRACKSLRPSFSSA